MRENLLALRQTLSLSQEDVARLAKTTQSVVSRAERGKASPAAIQAIADHLVLEIARRRDAEQEATAATTMQALAAAMPDSPEWRALREAIKERALDYLERCETVACDALLEMIPADEAGALLSSYLDPPDAAERSAAAAAETAPSQATGLSPEDPVTDTLADRIDAFIARYARIRRSYVPDEDEPDERFNGPDTAMLASAATPIRNGQRPHLVHSNWAMSGCYQIPDDAVEARRAGDEHDALVSEINALARGLE